ncbi:SDR family oxidoreductase [Micromonospora sp. CPCC 206060]|uniref:SDR family oxidoreductase n=1 Tax=Micromonospora sp. CPCC 206060 TaxID=3122406 RepID=UPI002FF2604C
MTERIALVTGVSRRVGIGAAVARRFAAAGYRLHLTGLPAFDEAQPYGGDPEGVPALLTELAGRATYQAVDLLDPAAPGELVAETVRRHGRIDVVVAVHAYCTDTPLGSLDPAEIDRHLIVNVRASMLLAEAFVAAFTSQRPTGSGGPARADGRLVLFSTGQRLGPMPNALAYAVSKAAVENLTVQLALLLMPQGITVNCVHPGPTDTGYAPPEAYAAVARRFPGGRWGTPDDAARLVEWLCSPDGGWITGQVIDSEGGFNRYG